MTKPEQAVIDAIDALVDWQMSPESPAHRAEFAVGIRRSVAPGRMRDEAAGRLESSVQPYNAPHTPKHKGSRVNGRQAEDRIYKREAFVSHSKNFSGRWESHATAGWLNGTVHADILRMDLQDSNGLAYVVYSYATPIAWWTAHAGWYLPGVGHSVITKTKHLPHLRRAFIGRTAVAA